MSMTKYGTAFVASPPAQPETRQFRISENPPVLESAELLEVPGRQGSLVRIVLSGVVGANPEGRLAFTLDPASIAFVQGSQLGWQLGQNELCHSVAVWVRAGDGLQAFQIPMTEEAFWGVLAGLGLLARSSSAARA